MPKETHTGEKPYQCPRKHLNCFKRFSRKDQVLRHLRRKHKEVMSKLSDADTVIIDDFNLDENLIPIIAENNKNNALNNLKLKKPLNISIDTSILTSKNENSNENFLSKDDSPNDISNFFTEFRKLQKDEQKISESKNNDKIEGEDSTSSPTNLKNLTLNTKEINQTYNLFNPTISENNVINSPFPVSRVQSPFQDSPMSTTFTSHPLHSPFPHFTNATPHSPYPQVNSPFNQKSNSYHNSPYQHSPYPQTHSPFLQDPLMSPFQVQSPAFPFPPQRRPFSTPLPESFSVSNFPNNSQANLQQQQLQQSSVQRSLFHPLPIRSATVRPKYPSPPNQFPSLDFSQQIIYNQLQQQQQQQQQQQSPIIPQQYNSSGIVDQPYFFLPTPPVTSPFVNADPPDPFEGYYEKFFDD
ncbi:hypothetical protein HDU92_008133 [Lobulomyces angularis]|nr:hypothetical protein HDU92_008133 [Lobulomyces angularis]